VKPSEKSRLGTPAKVIGGAWFLLGFGYLAMKTHGFCTKLVMTHCGDA
jgi:hypothetical protein